MAEQFYTILTNVGKAKIANALPTGTKVNLTKMKIGDSNGTYYNPSESQTELVHKVYECNVTSVEVDESNPNWITITAAIPSDVGGFSIREVGVFDDSNSLIAIGKYPETYKPVASDGSVKELYIKMTLEVVNASSVELKIDPTIILATKKDIANINTKVENVTTQLEQKAELVQVNQLKMQVDSFQTEQDLSPNKDIEVTAIRTNVVADNFPTSSERINNIERVLGIKKKSVNIEIVPQRGLLPNGDTGSSAGYSITKMIPVNEGDIVYYSGIGAVAIGTSNATICGYSEYIEGAYAGVVVNVFKQILLNSEGGTEYKHYYLKIPSGIKAIICHFRTDGSGTKDYGVSIYEPYKTSNDISTLPNSIVNWSNLSQATKDELEKYYGYNIKSCILKKYIARVGVEFNLYFDKLFVTTRPNDYYVVALENGVEIPTTKEYLRILPTQAGTRTIHLIVRGAFGGFEIGHYIINLEVINDVNISIDDKGIFIGDSLSDNTLTDNGFVDRIKEQLPNMVFYGTRPGKNGVNTEGRASWSTGHYCNSLNYAGMNNPFLNPSTSKFDFSYYIQQNPSFADVTLVNLFLGQNDGYSVASYDNLDFMINSIKSYNSAIKIYICMTNFEASDRLPSVFKSRIESMQKFKEKYESRESENIFIVPQCVNLDSFYDYGYGQKQISRRNTNTYLAITDGIHPNEFGRYKEADVWVSCYKYNNR